MNTAKNRHRSGNYVRQPQDYSAFVPKPLPPEPELEMDEELATLLADATLALGRLDGAIGTLPNPDLFVLMYIRKEAVLSSEIEGTQSSLTDVLEAEAKMLNPDRPDDVDEVINYVDAMSYGLRRLQELPVSIRLIREIHERLMHGVRGDSMQPGEIRTSQNWLGPGGATLKNAIYVPPPPSQVLTCLGDLEKFLHQPSDLHDLVSIGLAHAQFESIHPFLDGNGRVGRLLITFLLCERNILQHPVLYLSHYFKQHRAEYYDRLQAVRDRGDWENWIRFFLQGFAEVSNGAAMTARAINALRENHRTMIMETFGGRGNNAARILERLYTIPITDANTVRDFLDVTYVSANTLLAEMEERGIVKEITGRSRNRRFAYQDYIDLFTGE